MREKWADGRGEYPDLERVAYYAEEELPVHEFERVQDVLCEIAEERWAEAKREEELNRYGI